MAEDLYFAKKYRVKRLSDVRGNIAPINLLQSYLRQRKLPPYIILHGPYGCCKSAVATLLPLALNCEHPTVTGDACCECPTCKQLMKPLVENRENMSGAPYYIFDMGAKGDDEDYIDTVRNTIESLELTNVFGKQYCIILEEMQDISIKSQRALLKILENLPQGVRVIITLNDLWKVDKGIRDRAIAPIELKPPTEAELLPFTLEVCRQEGIKLNEANRRTLIRANNNNPRLILNALQVIKETGVAGLQFEFEKQTALSAQIEFYNCIKTGLFPIINYLRTVPDKVLFCKNMINFLNLAIEIRETKTAQSLPRDLIVAINNACSTINNDTMFRILGHLQDVRIYDEDQALAMLYRIAYFVNKSLYDDASLRTEASMAKVNDAVKSQEDAFDYKVGASDQNTTKINIPQWDAVTNNNKGGLRDVATAEDFLKRSQSSKLSRDDI